MRCRVWQGNCRQAWRNDSASSKRARSPYSAAPAELNRSRADREQAKSARGPHRAQRPMTAAAHVCVVHFLAFFNPRQICSGRAVKS